MKPLLHLARPSQEAWTYPYQNQHQYSFSKLASLSVVSYSPLSASQHNGHDWSRSNTASPLKSLPQQTIHKRRNVIWQPGSPEHFTRQLLQASSSPVRLLSRLHLIPSPTTSITTKYHLLHNVPGPILSSNPPRSPL